MYISLGHGHLSPEHDPSQYTLHHTSSPAPNCLHKAARQSDVQDGVKVEGYGASAWRALEAPVLRNKRG
jgi:hypothetical protein